MKSHFAAFPKVIFLFLLLALLAQYSYARSSKMIDYDSDGSSEESSSRNAYDAELYRSGNNTGAFFNPNANQN